MLMINRDQEDVLALEGSVTEVRAFLHSLAPLFMTTTFQESDLGLYGQMITPNGSLVRLVESPYAYELRILDDPSLTQVLSERAQDVFLLAQAAA